MRDAELGPRSADASSGTTSTGNRCHACDQYDPSTPDLPKLPMCARCAKAWRMGYRCGEEAGYEKAKSEPTDTEIRTRLLARIDALVKAADEAFEIADTSSSKTTEDQRERMRAKGHRLKATAHELGRALAPVLRGGDAS